MGKSLLTLLKACTVEIFCVAIILGLMMQGYGYVHEYLLGKTDLRNSDYPQTYISEIHLDLTSPHQWVTLSWEGPNADAQEKGPFRSSPGKGWGNNDCNDVVESRCEGSRCTPKGNMKVVEIKYDSSQGPEYNFHVVIDTRRAISFHSHPNVPMYPASDGCIRLGLYAAKLIHNNSRVHETKVRVDGDWQNPDGTIGACCGGNSEFGPL